MPHRSRIQYLEMSTIFDIFCSETVIAVLPTEDLRMVIESIQA